jgi:hypothetical protein
MGIQSLRGGSSLSRSTGQPVFPSLFARPVLRLVPSLEPRLRLSFQSKIYSQALSAKDEFKDAQEKGAGVEELWKISQNSSQLALQVLSYSRPTFIRPDADDDVLDQIIAKELVHKVGSREELRAKRLGENGDNKECLARVFDTKDGPKVLSQIFRAKFRLPEREGRVAFKDFPGDIVAVRDSDVEAFSGTANAYGYYAISSRWYGSGAVQIADANAASDGLIQTTISPMRDFTKACLKHCSREEMEAWSDAEFNSRFYEHLLNGVETPVTRDSTHGFHGHDNGAIFVGLHRNPNSEPIANYYYDPMTMEANIMRIRQGLLPVGASIYHDMSPDQIRRGAYNISTSSWAPIRS